MNDRSEILHALFRQTPSVQLWDAICEELALWDREALERVGLPYAREQFERWPDEVERWAEVGPLVTVRHAVGVAALKKLAQAGERVRWLGLSLENVGERASSTSRPSTSSRRRAGDRPRGRAPQAQGARRRDRRIDRRAARLPRRMARCT